MFIKKSRFSIRKHPLEIAFDMLKNAVAMVYGYKYDDGYKPTEHDLKMLDVFVDEMYQNYVVVHNIARYLHKRSKGDDEALGKINGD